MANQVTVDGLVINGQTVISVKPPVMTGKTPCDIYVAADKSGSMGTSVIKYEPSKDATKSDSQKAADAELRQFARIDLTNLAATAIAHSLDEDSSLELHTYDSRVYKTFPRQKMTAKGKDDATDAFSEITAGGQTAIWDGINSCMTSANNADHYDPTHFTATLCLTDGEPSDRPAGGENNAFRQSMQRGNKVPLINMGFTTGIKSKFLDELVAVDETNESHFLYISDQSMVLTTFVNLVANARSTFARGCIVRRRSSNTILGRIGFLRSGQPRTLVINSVVPLDDIDVVYKPYYNGQVDQIAPVTGSLTIDHANNIIGYWTAVNGVKAAIKKAEMFGPATAQAQLDELVLALYHTNPDLPIINDLSKSGEVYKSFTPSYWADWGEHYVRFIVSGGYMQEQCPNFKSESLSVFGDKLFEKIRDDTNDVVNSLKANPTAANYSWNDNLFKTSSSYGLSSSYGPSSPLYAPPSLNTQAAFNNPDNGCFAKDSIVSMADGSLKPASLIVKGDTVMTPHGPATVQCVVVYFGPTTTVRLASGLRITKWHPIYYDGRWWFPTNLITYGERTETAVYNFVLNHAHTIIVNSMACCTLGHNIEGPVIGHDFYGTSKVIDALKKFDSYASGVVHIDTNNVVRGLDGLVADYKVTEPVDAEWNGITRL